MKDKYCFQRMATVMICLILCTFCISAAARTCKAVSAAPEPSASGVSASEILDQEEEEVELEDSEVPLAIWGMTSDAGQISPILVASVMVVPILLAVALIRLVKLKWEL